MTALPTIPNFVDGILPTSQLVQLADVLDFLMQPPIAELRSSAAQSLATATWTGIDLAAEDQDSVDGHDNSTNPSRYTAVYPGRYLLGGGVGYASNVTGRRGARFAVNGTAVTNSEAMIPAITGGVGTSVAARSKTVYLGVGDYAELQGFQDSGGALNTGTGNGGSHFTVLWVSIA